MFLAFVIQFLPQDQLTRLRINLEGCRITTNQRICQRVEFNIDIGVSRPHRIDYAPYRGRFRHSDRLIGNGRSFVHIVNIHRNILRYRFTLAQRVDYRHCDYNRRTRFIIESLAVIALDSHNTSRGINIEATARIVNREHHRRIVEIHVSPLDNVNNRTLRRIFIDTNGIRNDNRLFVDVNKRNGNCSRRPVIRERRITICKRYTIEALFITMVFQFPVGTYFFAIKFNISDKLDYHAVATIPFDMEQLGIAATRFKLVTIESRIS